MNKKELIDQIADKTGVSKASAEKIVNGFLKSVTDTLEKGEKITLMGFGTFSIVKRAARAGKHPKTGEKITIPAKKAVKFKPGKKLTDSVK